MSGFIEGGIRRQRVEWVAETTAGTAPTNPQYKLFSDNLVSLWDGEPSNNKTSRLGIASPDPTGFFAGPEDHEAVFVYDLQRWPVDGAGDPQDPTGYGMVRNTDNDLPGTLTVISREAHATGGTADAGRRLYRVGDGGRVASVTLPFETGDGTPIAATVGIRFEKVRMYDVSQPASSTTITVSSTSANDNTQTVTIESDDATTTESLSLAGTSAVTGLATFSSVDAVRLDAECQGDILIEDSAGNDLLTIRGSDAYPLGEGDLGIPLLGSGSHGTELNATYEIFNDDSITNVSTGANIGETVLSGELVVENELQADPKAGGAGKAIKALGRTSTLTATIEGPAESASVMEDYLLNNSFNVRWTSERGTLDLVDAVVMSPGNPVLEANSVLQLDVQFEGEGLLFA